MRGHLLRDRRSQPLEREIRLLPGKLRPLPPQLLLLEPQHPPAEQAKRIEILPGAGGDIERHLVSTRLRGAKNPGIDLARSAPQNVEEFAFLEHLRIAGHKTAERIQMGFEPEAFGRRLRHAREGFRVAQVANPAIELGLLIGSQSKEPAVGTRFHGILGDVIKIDDPERAP